MGLDMYLKGEKFFTTYEGYKRRIEDGFEVSEHSLEIGYWRKHPDLHGYIVNTFNKGIDNCKPINLNPDNFIDIINAIKEDRLPKTTGFFFGTSENDEQEKQEAIEIFEKAFNWLVKEQKGCWKSVIYQASW
ncbi:hypothetical protein [Flavisericum labens]|uniref:hypothetical protein n=1 Tax=Flavisericum labens TaxID=3377112 RepID=UPI00387B0402